MKALFVIALFLAFTGEKRMSDTGGLQCVLKSDKSVYKAGELPKITVEILNTGKKDIYLIGSLDGSADKRRFPYCYFTIEKPQPEVNVFGGCGNLNTLQIADFRLIKSGEKFDPYESGGNYQFFKDGIILNSFTFRHPGNYKIRFHYSTGSQNISDFMGTNPIRKDSLAIQQLNTFFKQVPKIDLVSNEVVLRVEK